MTVDDSLRRIADDLRDMQARWAVVGGFAVSVRSEPRFTRDADVAIAVDDDVAAERIARALFARGYLFQASVEQEAGGRLMTVRLIPPGTEGKGSMVDLLFASSGIEREVVAAATEEEVVEGLRARVATRGHLIAMKLLSERPGRPQDSPDLLALIRESDESDLATAREGIRLIESRGFARGKDLQATLDHYVAFAAEPA
jgi:hypothetical protein